MKDVNFKDLKEFLEKDINLTRYFKIRQNINFNTL